MTLNIGSLNIFVQQTGTSSPALVFLHYWGGSHRTWNKVIEELEGTWQCVSYDSRGWGRSDKSATDFSMADLVDEVLGIIQALHVREFVLIGHSMGGKVAQLAASLRPEGLKALILVAPATPTPTHFPDAALQQQLHAYDDADTVRQTIGFLSAKALPESEVSQIMEDSLSGSEAARKAWPTIGIVEDISEALTSINVPTLVIAGGRDNLDSVEQHEREVVSPIAGAKLVVIPASGHLLPYDEPSELAMMIRKFLSSVL